MLNEDDCTAVWQALLLTFCLLAPSFSSTRGMSITQRFMKEPLASHETASFSPFPLSDMEIGVKLFAPMPMRAVSVGFAYHGVMYVAFAANETAAIANARRRI